MKEIIHPNKIKEGITSKYKNQLGLLLIKPDAISIGAGEYLIEYTRERMKNEVQAEMQGVFIIDEINRTDLSYMYPDLPAYKLDLATQVFNLGPSVLVTFKGSGSNTDLWANLKEIRGASMRDLEENSRTSSIRSFLPLPGFFGDYRLVAEKLRQHKTVSVNEELILHFNMAHTPDTIDEVAGLLKLVETSQLVNIFGSEAFDQMKTEIFPYLTKGN